MWIFGKKANQQSTTEVPPELQQYYGRPTLGDRLRQASLFVLPLLAFLVIIAGVIWGASWLRHKPSTPAKPQQQSQAPSTQNNQSSQPPSSDQQNGSQSQSQGAASGSDQSVSNSQSPSSSTAPTTIPATGPGGVTFAIAGVTTVVSAAAFHLHQVRRMRSNI